MRHNPASHTPLILISISDFFFFNTITLFEPFLEIGVYQDTERKQTSKETHPSTAPRLRGCKSEQAAVTSGNALRDALLASYLGINQNVWTPAVI